MRLCLYVWRTLYLARAYVWFLWVYVCVRGVPRSPLPRLGVPYFFESQPIIAMAGKQAKKVTSICAWCSRMKRGILYSTARREGYNVLVLGQHLDDMVLEGCGCYVLR